MARKKLSAQEIEEHIGQLDGWKVRDGKLSKRFEFKNFAAALDFINRVGRIAEQRDHHPDICFGWGYAEFEIITHDVGGLTHNDFELAEEIDQVNRE